MMGPKPKKADVRGVFDLLAVLADPEAYKAKLADLAAREERAEELAGAVKTMAEAEALREQAKADADAAAAKLEDSDVKARALVRDAQETAEAIEADAQSARSSLDAELARAEEVRKKLQGDLVAREAAIAQKESQVKARENAVADREAKAAHQESYLKAKADRIASIMDADEWTARMAKTYYLPAEASTLKFRSRWWKGAKDTISIDASAWAEDNGTITAATWTVDSGNATVSGEALASDVASALVTFGEVGRQRIKVTVTDGTELGVVWIEALVTEPDDLIVDYGLSLV